MPHMVKHSCKIKNTCTDTLWCQNTYQGKYVFTVKLRSSIKVTTTLLLQKNVTRLHKLCMTNKKHNLRISNMNLSLFIQSISINITLIEYQEYACLLICTDCQIIAEVSWRLLPFHQITDKYVCSDKMFCLLSTYYLFPYIALKAKGWWNQINIRIIHSRNVQLPSHIALPNDYCILKQLVVDTD
jgi:hypothetical protein